MPRQPRRISTQALALASLLASASAHANGAFPDEFSIHFPANAPHRILMGANFGLLVSEDDGNTWRYSCEPWVVAGSNAALATANVSFYQVTQTGAVLATAVNVTRSEDDACTWPVSTGSVSGQVVTDFFASPTDATFVIAIVTTFDGSYIVASHDGGKTFDDTRLYDTTKSGPASSDHSGDLLTGIEIARSNPGVVYATSIPQSGAGARFFASSSSGAAGSWTITTLGVPAGTQPRILTIDPADAKIVYLRLLTGISDAMAVTADGGQTFNTLLNINGQFSSFLRANDGTVYAGSMDGKIWIRPANATDPKAFTQHAAPHLRCLGQRYGTDAAAQQSPIYACADMILDGYSLAKTQDGVAFTKVMSFTDLLGPLTCSAVSTNCQAHWERIQGVLGIGADAGTGGGGGGGGGGTPAPSGKSGCASAGADTWSLWLLAAVACWSRRRAG